MLRLLMADAIFIAVVLFEIIAAVSLIQSLYGIALRQEFEPVLAFYRGQAAPFLTLGARLVYSGAPQWFADASILSAVFFFLFFITQARSAMAPYGAHIPNEAGRIETALDWALPAIFCAAGAAISAPTLLPLFTLPAALVLGVRGLMGLNCWIQVSRSYYVNMFCLGLALAGIFWL